MENHVKTAKINPLYPFVIAYTDFRTTQQKMVKLERGTIVTDVQADPNDRTSVTFTHDGVKCWADRNAVVRN